MYALIEQKILDSGDDDLLLTRNLLRLKCLSLFQLENYLLEKMFQLYHIVPKVQHRRLPRQKARHCPLRYEPRE